MKECCILFISILLCFVNAQTYSLSGNVYFKTTQQPAYPATLELYSVSTGGFSLDTNVEVNGDYKFNNIPEGEYTIMIIYDTTTFSTMGFNLEDLLIQENTNMNFIVPDVILDGSIYDAVTQNPVGNSMFTASAFSRGKGGFDTIDVSTLSTGTFNISILPNEYFDLEVDVPNNQYYAGQNFFTGYYEFYSPVNYIDLPLEQIGEVSGYVYFASDGSIVAGAKITAISDGSAVTSTLVDSTGFYSLQLAGNSEFTLSVTFSCSGPNPNSTFSSSNFNAGAVQTIPGGMVTKNLYVNDSILTGTVVDSSYNIVPGAKLSASAFSLGNGGFDSLEAQATQSGGIAVRIILNSYFDILLEPPSSSSQYIATNLPDEDWTSKKACTGNTFIIESEIIVHGIALFEDGEYLPPGSKVNTNQTFDSSYPIDETGGFQLPLYPSTFLIMVEYTWVDPSNPDSTFSTFGTAVQPLTVTDGPAYTSLPVPYVTFSGFIVDSTNKPVPGATLNASAFSSGFNGGFDYLSLVADSNGHFFGKILANTYMDVTLSPPPESSYVTTPLGDYTVSVSENHVLFVIDSSSG